MSWLTKRVPTPSIRTTRPVPRRRGQPELQPAAADVPKIKASLLIHYAELDERINAGWPEYEAALIANESEFTAYFYPGVNHGFHNDSTPRYDPEAAQLAWDRTIAFFEEKLPG